MKPSGSILALFAEPLNFSSLTLYLGLVGVHLFLLIRLLNFLSLHLVANKSASTETKRAANRRSGPRMAHGGTDDSARRGAPSAPIPAPFSRVVRFPPEQPTPEVRIKKAATIISACFIVPPEVIGAVACKTEPILPKALPLIKIKGTIQLAASRWAL